MYTLRTFEGQLESNRSLGNNYQVLLKEVNYEEFKQTYKLFWKQPYPNVDDEQDRYSINTYGFVICSGGSEIIPLYKGDQYYIMTDSGKTFDNLTYK